MGVICLLCPLQYWQREKPCFVGPPSLSFPRGCRCCVGQEVPGTGCFRNKQKDQRGMYPQQRFCWSCWDPTTESPPKQGQGFVLSGQSSFTAAPALERSPWGHPAHHKSPYLLSWIFETTRPHNSFPYTLVLFAMSIRGSQRGQQCAGAGCWIAAPCPSPRLFYCCQALLLCANMRRDGKLTGNYFSWKMVLSITYQKHRKPQGPHNQDGGVEERVACRKGLSQCHHFPNSFFSKENECKQNPGWATNWRIENIERKFLYYSSHHYTWIRTWAFFLSKYSRKWKCQSKTL